MVVSCKPRANYIFLRSAPRRHTGANVLQGVVGRDVFTIDTVMNERMVALTLSGDKSLAVNLFGPHANVYLVNGSGEIEESFLRKKKPTAGIPPGGVRESAGEENVRRFIEDFAGAAGSPLQRLAAVIPPFSGNLGKEALFRTGGDELLGKAKDRNAVIDQARVSALYEGVSDLRRELSHPQPRIYYEGDQPVMMSLIEMRHLGDLAETAYGSVNSCVTAFAAEAEKHKSGVELKTGVLDRLRKRRDVLTDTIRKIGEDISGNREEKYRKAGDTIMENLGTIDKGAVMFRAKDDSPEIRLDPKLSAVQNAQAYYEKAKKARESYRQAVVREQGLKRLLNEVEAELSEIEAGKDQKQILSLARADKAKESAQTPFREFETNGYKIYVGKDARNNDQLTFGFAKPNDVFLHARGVSGSHVIIRNGSRDYPPKPILEFAGKIAAHYSKARTSGIVPVAYTMRKFVKKAKGKPGAVIVDREEVIFVKPGIPQLLR